MLQIYIQNMNWQKIRRLMHCRAKCLEEYNSKMQTWKFHTGQQVADITETRSLKNR
jgi:hypothetical protein